MSTSPSNLSRFEVFVTEIRDLVVRTPGDEKATLARGKELLAELVRHDDWLPPVFSRPDPLRYRQYPLHVDALGRFSIVSFVWGPGQQTPIHDHTVWGLIGVLRGAERSERFELQSLGQPMRRTGESVLSAGDVGCVSPTLGDIHRVQNAFNERPSISIHVYGSDIGKTVRHSFDEATGHAKRFMSGYSAP